MKTARGSAPGDLRVVGPGRKSSFSPNADCVELFRTTDSDVVAVRNSNDYAQGTVFVHRTAWGNLIAGAKAGELDDLV